MTCLVAEPLKFDPFQFANRNPHPVHAEINGDGGWETPGLSFDDYGFCQIQRNSTNFFIGKNTTPPAWTLNNSTLGNVLARFMEQRALMRTPYKGTPEARIRFAVERLNRVVLPSKMLDIKRLCDEYAGSDEIRRRELERVIKALDGEIQNAKLSPSVFLGVIWRAYRVGEDTVALAERTGLSRNNIRIICFRMNHLAEKIARGEDNPAIETVPYPWTPRWLDALGMHERAEEERARIRKQSLKYCRKKAKDPAYLAEQAARMKARRAAETPEQREARLKKESERHSRTWREKHPLKLRKCPFCKCTFRPKHGLRISCPKVACRLGAIKKHSHDHYIRRVRAGLCSICGKEPGTVNPKTGRTTTRGLLCRERIEKAGRAAAAGLLRGNQQELVDTHAVAVGV